MSLVGKIIFLAASVFVLAAMAGVAGATTASLSNTNYIIAENGGSIGVNVVLDSDPGLAGVDVTYAVNPDTAVYGSNYTIVASTGTLHFSAGQTSKPITVTIIDNHIFDINRIFFVNLTSATCTLTARDATVTITEDEHVPAVILLPVTASGQPWIASVREGSAAALQAIKVSTDPGQITPLGIATDLSTGYVYVTDFYNHRVQVFDQDGVYLRGFGSYGTSSDRLMYPYGIAVNNTGYVFVTDASNQVKVFENDGDFLFAFGSGILKNPKGIAISASGRIIVADSGNNRFVSYDVNGLNPAYLSSYQYPVTGETMTFRNPTGVAVNSEGSIYVSDTDNNRIVEFDGSLHYVTQFSTDLLGLKAPEGIAVSNDDHVFVVDNDNFRVVIYNCYNEVQGSLNLDGYGDGMGQFKNPRMIAVCGGRIYVTDSTLNRVTYFTTGGLCEGMWGGPYTTQPVSVNYKTFDGTAIASQNYTAADVKLTFQPAEYVKTFSVGTIATAGYKLTKFFFVNLTGPSGAIIGNQYPYTMVEITNNNDVNQAPKLWFDVIYYTVSKDAGHVTLQVNKTGLTNLPATVEYYTVDGTAKQGDNYVATTGTLTFEPGETSRTFDVPVVNWAGSSPALTFSVGLRNPANAVIAAVNNTAHVTILSPQMPAVQFSASSYTVNENAGHVTLTVTKTGSTTQEVRVSYATVASSAIAGTNYQAASGTLIFAPGETSKDFDVTIYNIPGYNPDCTFLVSLGTPVNANWGNPNVAIVNIHNVDTPVSLRFSTSSYPVNENAGTVTLTVTRTGDLAGTSVALYSTADGTATAGLHYTSKTGTLTFGPTESSKTFTVGILNVPGYNPDSAFSVTLGAVTNAVIGTPGTATVNIHNIDPEISVQFNQSTCTVWENATAAIVNLTLSEKMTTDVTVTYETKEGTAKPVKNYTYMTGTVTIPAGTLYRLVSVPLADNTCNDTSVFFYVNITGVSPNVRQGTPDVANVTIQDDEFRFAVGLYKGWNMISSPVVLGPLKASDLCRIYPDITMVMRYNNNLLKYDLYTVGAPSAYDFDFKTDKGYLVYSGRNMDITFIGNLPDGRTLSLTKSWNMIGWSTYHTSDASAICTLLPGGQMVMTYDGLNHKYKLYTPGAPSEYNFIMGPGSGYLLYSDTVTMLNYGGI